MIFNLTVFKISVLSVFLLLSSCLIAQNGNQISGKIFDSSNKQVIPFANILNLSSKIYSTSNSNGEFEIFANLNDSIEITNVGFSTKIFSIDSSCFNNQIQIKLVEKFIDIDEVVVTATRTEKMLKNVPVLTQVIATTQMKNSGLTNVGDIINTLKPGVDFYNEGRGMTFRTQGLSAKYTLFLIDGERIAGENRDNIDYSRLVSSNIERIEIVQGASSSLYGSNAIGGVINLITRVPKSPLEANMYSKYSKFNELETGFNLGFKLKKFTFFTDGVRKKSDGYDKTLNTPDLYTIEPFEIFSSFNKLIFDVNDNIQLSARFSYFTRERFDVVEIPKHPFYNDLSSGVSAKINCTEKLNFTASVYRDSYGSFEVFEKRNDSLGMVYRNIQSSSKLIANYEIASKKSNFKQQITSGLEYFYDEVFSERIEDSTKFSKDYVVFFQDEINFFNNINLTFGTRNDYNSDFGNSFSPKASFMYKHKKMNYRLTVAKGLRTPGIKERNYDFDLGFIVIKGNKDLIPEKSFYKSISSEYLANHTNVSLCLYHNYLKDMILEQAIPGIYNGYTYKNVSNVEISGIDFLMRTKPLKMISFNTGYSFTYAIDKDTKKMLSGVSKHSATFGVDVFLKKKKNIFGISFNGKIYGKKDFVNMTETGMLFDDTYQTYTLCKASIVNRLFSDAIVFNIGVDNVFNYITVGDLINIDPGRRLFVSINISCDKLYKQFKIN